MNPNPNKLTTIASSLTFAAILALTGCQSTDNYTSSTASPASAAKPYPLKTCLVMDDAIDKDAFTFVHNGQEIKLCCEGCREDFDKDPAKYLKKLAAK